MKQNNHLILTEANAAISKGDFDGFLKFCAEDIVWNMIGDESLRGKEAVRQWMKRTYVKPPQFNVDQAIEEGEMLAVSGEITLQNPDGSSTHSKYCDVWRVRGGKLAELNAYAIEIN